MLTEKMKSHQICQALSDIGMIMRHLMIMMLISVHPIIIFIRHWGTPNSMDCDHPPENLHDQIKHIHFVENHPLTIHLLNNMPSLNT